MAELGIVSAKDLLAPEARDIDKTLARMNGNGELDEPVLRRNSIRQKHGNGWARRCRLWHH